MPYRPKTTTILDQDGEPITQEPRDAEGGATRKAGWLANSEPVKQTYSSSGAKREYQTFHNEDTGIGYGLVNKGETDPSTRFQKAYISDNSSDDSGQMTYEKFVKIKARERQQRQEGSLNRADQRG